MQNEIMVSVICNAYNHELYIEKALKGFVMQKTNFKFEVLVHDDASTDKTADMIRQYEKKYPELIKPIYQTENQYSKKPGLVSKTQYARVSGKYIALCEGDDYWTDPFKLQKQFDAMESNPGIDICAHTASAINATTNKKINTVMPSKKNCILSLEQVILGGGGFVATNSLFFRSSLNDNIPEFRKFLSLDGTLQIHGSIRGGMLYLKDNMSVYQVGIEHSWTDRMSKNKKDLENHNNKVVEMLNILDKDLGYKYTDTIKKKILLNEFKDLYYESDIDSIMKEPYRQLFNELTIKRKIKVLVLGTIRKVLGQRVK